MIDLTKKRILVTGASGFFGKHIVQKLKQIKCRDLFTPTSAEYDLMNRAQCRATVKGIDIVIHAAGRVGGSKFNRDKPGEIAYNNIVMGAELIEAARQAGVEKFVILGTICAYPRGAPLPFKEESLWNGYPEEPTATHGITQRALLTQLKAYRAQYGFNGICLLPVNLYGPGDHLNPGSIRLIPALIQKVLIAKEQGRSFIEMTGQGSNTLDMLFVEDAAEGVILAAQQYDQTEPVNLGSGLEVSIKEITEKICSLLNFSGEIRWLNEGIERYRRSVDISKAQKYFGFKAHTSFDQGLKATLKWYLREVR